MKDVVHKTTCKDCSALDVEKLDGQQDEGCQSLKVRWRNETSKTTFTNTVLKQDDVGLILIPLTL